MRKGIFVWNKLGRLSGVVEEGAEAARERPGHDVGGGAEVEVDGETGGDGAVMLSTMLLLSRRRLAGVLAVLASEGWMSVRVLEEGVLRRSDGFLAKEALHLGLSLLGETLRQLLHIAQIALLHLGARLGEALEDELTETGHVTAILEVDLLSGMDELRVFIGVVLLMGLPATELATEAALSGVRVDMRPEGVVVVVDDIKAEGARELLLPLSDALETAIELDVGFATVLALHSFVHTLDVDEERLLVHLRLFLRWTTRSVLG